MKKLFLATAALVGLIGSQAFAADMPLKAPPVPYVAGWSWTGFYIGGSIGAMWDRIDGAFVNPPIATWSTNQSTGVVDAHAGVQYQFGSNIVLGVEGDYISAFRDNSGTDGCHPAAACGAGTMLAGRINDMWTIGGRAGWSFGSVLPYVSGGWASARVDMNVNTAAGVLFESTRTRHGGGYIGGGIDWRVWQNLVAGVEYRHYEFGSVTATPILAATGVANPFDTWTLKVREDTFSARLSWLFNWGGGPISTRY